MSQDNRNPFAAWETPRRRLAAAASGMLFACLASAASLGAAPEFPILLALSPRKPPTEAVAHDALDLRYPAGSRVVLATAPFRPGNFRTLSGDLFAAGDVVVSCDGAHAFFAGKASASSAWQIYETSIHSARPHVLTEMPGGAMDPALLPDGSLVFASPVPGLPSAEVFSQASTSATAKSREPPPALYAQAPGGEPRRLTFAPGSATDPTVLTDGRILFVYTAPRGRPAAAPSGLYTINNDGTEITAMAGQRDPPSTLARPRQLPDGRIAFLSAPIGASASGGRAEFIRLARPFQSRARFFGPDDRFVRSIQPAGGDQLLVCGVEAPTAPAGSCNFALFQVGLPASSLGQPCCVDAAYDFVEAVPAEPHTRPMGRISSMDPTKRTGQVLCLDANFTSYLPAVTNGPVPVATRIRVLAEIAPGQICVLGEVPLQEDGSFMAEVPADLPLGFDALDDQHQVLRRVDPMIWLRSGENRSCVGCHAPHNRAPHNHRPLAVRVPVPRLGLEEAKIARRVP